MGIAPQRLALIDGIAPLGFDSQETRSGDLVFVRKSSVPDLYERIELAFTGQHRDCLVIGIGIAVVLFVENQFRGLIQRAGLEELADEPETGKVRFNTRTEQSRWIERLKQVAPAKVQNLTHDRGAELLTRTMHERGVARLVFEDIVLSMFGGGSGSIERFLDHDQNILRERLSSKALVIGSQRFASQYGLAIAALIRHGDVDILASASNPSPLDPIAAIGEVSLPTMHKIRILVDLIVQHEYQIL